MLSYLHLCRYCNRINKRGMEWGSHFSQRLLKSVTQKASNSRKVNMFILLCMHIVFSTNLCHVKKLFYVIQFVQYTERGGPPPNNTPKPSYGLRKYVNLNTYPSIIHCKGKDIC